VNITCLKGKEMTVSTEIIPGDDTVKMKILGTDKYIDLGQIPSLNYMRRTRNILHTNWNLHLYWI
jgi:hypothetical protein